MLHGVAVGKAALGMGWYPGGWAGLVVLMGQSPHFSSVSPLIPLIAALPFSPCPTEVVIYLYFCPSANGPLCPERAGSSGDVNRCSCSVIGALALN